MKKSLWRKKKVWDGAKQKKNQNWRNCIKASEHEGINSKQKKKQTKNKKEPHLTKDYNIMQEIETLAPYPFPQILSAARYT